MPRRRFQVERQAALVAVQVLEIGAMARPPAPRRARRRFDLDHLGAPVGQLAHRGRTGAHARQVQHLEAGDSGIGGRSGMAACGLVRRPSCKAGRRVRKPAAAVKKPPRQARRLGSGRGPFGPGSVSAIALREDDLDAAVLRLADTVGGRHALVVLAVAADRHRLARHAEAGSARWRRCWRGVRRAAGCSRPTPTRRCSR